MYTNKLKWIYVLIMALSFGSIGLQYSFAQTLGEQIGDAIGGVLDEAGQAANENIVPSTTSILKDSSINNSASDRRLIVTNNSILSDQINQPYNFNTSIPTTNNISQAYTNSENTTRLDDIQSVWRNFSSTDGYNLSYPPEWNLTTYENEVYIESNQLDSDYYPKMTIFIRDLDPSKLNTSILLADILPIGDVPSEIANILLNNTKTLSNIGLKYYVDLGYDVVEPTQKDKYIIDGKQTSAFKVHESGENYEIEHITVNNNDKIYNIEINSDYYPSTIEDAAKTEKFMDKILNSIKWTNDTKPTIETKLEDVKLEDSENKSNDDENKNTIITAHPDINITSVTDFIDGDNLHIVGEIRNTATTDKDLVQVTATLYDNNRNAIGTDFTYTDPLKIPAQESAPFKLVINKGDVSNVSAIKSYKLYLTAQSDQSQSSKEEITLFNNSNLSSNNNISENSVNINPLLNKDEFAINATLRENAFGNMSNSYSIENFEFRVGSNSTICPGNNCEFGLENGNLWSFNAGEY